MDEGVDQRPGIQSVEIAATILSCLARGGGVMALSSLARLADMSTGKVHRYLISLTRSGLVEQDEETGHYRIGRLAVSLGLCGLRITSPLRTALAALPRLRNEINETTVLSVWADLGPTLIALEESHRPITMNIRVGSVLPLRTSAAGKVFAAHLPQSQTRDFLAGEFASGMFNQMGVAAVPSAGAFESELVRVRELGYAAVEGAVLPGLNAIAAPIFDYRGELSSVVGLVGHETTVSTAPNAPHVVALLRCAESVSEALGHTPLADRASS